MMMHKFLGVDNLKQIKSRSLLLNFVNEEIQEVVCVKDYYDLKDKNAFRFEKYSKDHANNKDSDHENQNKEADQDFEGGSEDKANGKRMNVDQDNIPNKKIYI